MQDGVRILTETDLSVITTTKQTQYGAKGCTEDGREFRYVQFGGTTTVYPGYILQAAVAVTNALALAITAVGTGGQVTANLANGSTTLVVTNGATAVTQDEFAEGFLEVNVGGTSATAAYSYRIKGNSAAAASTGYIQVYLAEPLRNTTALIAGTDTVNLCVSPYQGPIATTTVNVPIGMCIVPVVNSATVTNYGWVQTKGEAVGICDGSSMVIGNTVGPSTTTAGFVSLSVTTTRPPIGFAKTTVSSGATTAPIVLAYL